jgi:hypothetical protein
VPKTKKRIATQDGQTKNQKTKTPKICLYK